MYKEERLIAKNSDLPKLPRLTQALLSDQFELSDSLTQEIGDSFISASNMRKETFVGHSFQNSSIVQWT